MFPRVETDLKLKPFVQQYKANVHIEKHINRFIFSKFKNVFHFYRHLMEIHVKEQIRFTKGHD